MSERPRRAAQAETEAGSPQPPGAPRLDALALWAFLAGPVAFSIDLACSYFLVPRAHLTGSKLPLHVVTLAAFVVLLTGAWAGGRVVRAPAAGARGDPLRVAERSRFLALAGLLLCAFFLGVLVAEALPKILLAPRD